MPRSDEPSHPAAPEPEPIGDIKTADLSREVPSPRATLRINRRPPEIAHVTVEIRLGALHLTLRHRVRGVVSSIGPLAVAVITLAIVAAVAVPRVILTDSATNTSRMATAAVAGATVLIAGLGVTVTVWLKRRKS